MAWLVSSGLLGFVYFAVSFQHCTMVRAKDNISLRRVQVDQLDELDEMQMIDNDGTNRKPDSSTRILHKFFQRRVPKQKQQQQQEQHPNKSPPLPLKGQPKPILYQTPKDDLFAAKYSHFATYYKGKSGSSKRKSHHAYNVKGGKQQVPFDHHFFHSATAEKYDAWFYKPKDIVDHNVHREKWTKWVPPGVRKGNGKGYPTTGGGGGWNAGSWWEPSETKGKGQSIFISPPPPTHVMIPPFHPPPPADGPTVLPPTPTPDTPGTFTILAPPVTGQAGSADQFGRAVASSRFGNYMAVGSPYANESTGLVRVYQLSNGGSALFSSWDQVGQDIEGPQEPGAATISLTGFALDISDDGTVLIVGDLGVYNQTGQVRVFAYNPAEDRWVQRGDVIRGENPGDIFGAAVAMSSTGDIVAVGAPGYTNSSAAAGEGENVGQVRAYIWNSATLQWEAFGSAIFGDDLGDLAGFSVSLSADGQTMVYGLPTHDVEGRSSSGGGVEVFLDAGQVRVVEMDRVSGDWISRGDPINGTMDGAEAGWDVELSGDGNRIIVGMPGTTVTINGVATEDTGIISVYQQQEGSFSRWVQLGQEFLGNGQYIEGGETPGSRLGQSVAMSSDGMTIAFSAGPVVDSSGVVGGGRVPVYVCNDAETEWIQRDCEIIVDTIGPRPYAVSLSDDGSIVLVGAIGIDDVGTSTGYRSSSTGWG